MFERFKQPQGNESANLRHELQAYQAALREIGARVGVQVEDGKPAAAAAAICAAISRQMGGVRIDPLEAGEEERPVHAGVTQLRVSGAAKVIVVPGAVPRLTIRCSDKGYLPRIVTDVSGDTLTISQEPTSIVVGTGGGKVRIGGAVGAAFYTGDVVVGATVEASLVLPSLRDVCLSGAASVTYDGISQDGLSAEVAGSGELRLGGRVGSLEAEASGAGSINAFDLTAATATLRVSGAGKVRATVTNALKARVAGAGSIKVAGDPYPRDTKISGAGKVKFVDRT